MSKSPDSFGTFFMPLLWRGARRVGWFLYLNHVDFYVRKVLVDLFYQERMAWALSAIPVPAFRCNSLCQSSKL